MGKPFKLSLVSDVKDFLKGTQSVEDSLEKVASSLDDVSTVGENVEAAIVRAAKESEGALDKLSDESKDAGKNIEKGLKRGERGLEEIQKDTRKTERTFSQAAKKMRKDADRTGKSIGDDIKRGTEEASEGVKELREESVDSAREMAASFQGGADDIADLLQEVAANAFKGFGPAGMAAGIAAAVGIGYIISSLQESAEEAAEAKEKVLELADEINEVGGDPRALDWANRLRDSLKEIVDEKSWYEFWQDAPKTRLEEWSEASKKWGFTMQDATRGIAGDTEALRRVQDRLRQVYEDTAPAIDEYKRAGASASTEVEQNYYAALNAREAVDEFRKSLNEQKDVAQDAAAINEALNDSIAGLPDAVQEAREATESYESAVVESLESAASSWEKYTSDGVVNLSEYNAAMEAQAAAIQDFEANLVEASSDLSSEALNYIKSLGPEAAPLLQAFVNAPLDEKQRTAANWNAVGRAATDGYKQSLKLEQKTREATNAAQKSASGSPITFKTRLDSTLQRDVNWAAQTLSIPVIEVPVRAKKVID